MQRVILPNDIIFAEVSTFIDQGKTVTMKVKGRSMIPFIIGDRDSVELQKTESINVGDVVLARLKNGSYVMHRVVKIIEKNVVLMGDGTLYGTEECCPAEILATVFRIERNGKWVDCSTTKERFRVRIWMALLPLRRYILAIYRRLGCP